MSTLGGRLNRPERSISAPLKQGRVFRVMTGKDDEAEARELLEAEGYHAENGDLAIIRIIFTPAGQPPYSEPPYLMDRHRAQ
jgi:hypothetical protein